MSNRTIYNAIRTLLPTVIITAVFSFGILGHAAFNPEINYQGKLLDTSGSAVADGQYHMIFKLYTVPTDGTEIFEEDRSTNIGDRITVTDGLFSVLLGSSTALTGIDFNQTLYLSVEIGGSGGSPVFDGEMTPRKKLGVVPAAFEADKLDGIDSTSFVRNDSGYTLGDILYADALNSLTTLGVGSPGQILKISGGVPTWSTDLQGGGGSGAWATTTDNLAIYTVDTTDVVIVGSNATSTTGNIFEVVGNALFGNLLTAYNTITAPTFSATSTTATSTFAGGIQVNALDVQSTTASSTFANGIVIEAGCVTVGGTCLGGASAFNDLTDVTITSPVF
ncbi:hypothetical protein IIB50_02865, partial [Patescibacteria group bacterium]|nr:hypothetical protein [Patescibacteria group bacterium]